MKRTKKTALLTSLGTAALLTTLAGLVHAQTTQELLDLGAGTSTSDVCPNPFPNDPWPAGLFVAAQTPSLGYGVLSADLTQSLAGFGGIVDAFAMRNAKLVSTVGALFEAGETLPDGNTAWHVRRSLDHGATWQSLGPDWRLAAGKSAGAKGVTVDASGRVYACGRAADSRGNFHPIIRRSADNGASWVTVLDGSRGANFDTVANILFVPAVGVKPGGVFAVGRVGNNWTVWRSRDGGATWPVVHSWAPSKGIAEATAIASDANGNLYVGGMGNRANYPRDWFVWRSVNSGDTWQDLGNTLPAATDNTISDLEVDATGSILWVVGRSLSINGTSQRADWTMQAWTPASGWGNPVLPYASLSTDSRAQAVGLDTLTGSFYVSGWVVTTDSQQHGTVLSIGN